MWIKFKDGDSYVAVDASEVIAVSAQPMPGRSNAWSTAITIWGHKTFEIAQRDVSDLILYHLNSPRKINTIDLTSLKRRGGFIKVI